MTSVVTFPQAQSALRRERDGTDWEESSLRAQTPHTADTHWSSPAYAASVGGAVRRKTPPPGTGLHAERLMMLSVLFKMLLILDMFILSAASFLFEVKLLSHHTGCMHTHSTQWDFDSKKHYYIYI